MAVIKQGGTNPYAGKTLTSTGYKDNTRRCMSCGLKKEDELFTVDANGKAVCPDCASSGSHKVLRPDCEDGVCVCFDRDPEDGKLEDATLPDD